MLVASSATQQEDALFAVSQLGRPGGVRPNGVVRERVALGALQMDARATVPSDEVPGERHLVGLGATARTTEEPDPVPAVSARRGARAVETDDVVSDERGSNALDGELDEDAVPGVPGDHVAFRGRCAPDSGPEEGPRCGREIDPSA